MMIEIILIVIVVLGIITFLYFWMRRNKGAIHRIEEARFDFDSIQKYVSDALQNFMESSLYEGNPSTEEYNRRKARRNELRKALRSCMHGNLSTKKYVKIFIRTVLDHYGFNEFNVNQVIPFDRAERLTPQDCFDIILQQYMKEHDRDALNQLIQKYHLDELKPYATGSKGYKITSEEIRQIYQAEQFDLSFNDKMDVIVQRVYQSFKGLGVIDEIRDQKIDGVNGGTSGVPTDIAQSMDAAHYLDQTYSIPKTYDAVWIFYRGKSIHLEFLSFGSELELKRVCQNIYTFGNPGQLNEAKGFMVNDMADGSRVVVVRPKMSESWAFFVRKFDVRIVEIEDLIKGENAFLPIMMSKFLIKGERITAVTGRQGSGKTTLMMALIGFINRRHNIRVQEMSFELRARKMYPDRNILTFRETPTISGQKGLDTQKKTDGSVSILGEVADHPVASLMVQIAQVASEYTFFSHHGKTFPNLVSALRNSLIADGAFSNEKAAEKQVVDVLGFNIHLDMTASGKRFVERITECIPLEDDDDYPMHYKEQDNLNQKLDAIADTLREYFYRQTDRKTYTYQDIIVWEQDKYVAKNCPTDRNIMAMLNKMDDADADDFISFLEENWGYVI